MPTLRPLLMQALVAGALALPGCRPHAATAQVPRAEARAPRGTEVSLSFEGGLRSHYQALPLLEAQGIAARFVVPERALGTPGHLTRLQLGLVEEAGHEVVLRPEDVPCGGAPVPEGELQLVVDGRTPPSQLAAAVGLAEAAGGGRVELVFCDLEEGRGYETLAQFLAWVAPRAQSGTHVRLARR
ncbi:hypothetical protein FGE12_16450 [Aggregicoccus sp. 17bor-14]|uniref:hypothetical protein n=1 Tax=Myxococcaceae TaxID=31 RepID=UPI00129C3960|nr:MULTISPECIES: hypothetical protein [Myxococcaceae]MBF5043991.1 hypothetical protein [Simulacricoccus sp. 17bor-14]MRI89742.1 hypothetical protein [Aggregicoccus sp. 17bor-14]